MKKRKILIVTAGVVICLVIVGAGLIWNKMTDYSTTISINWGFSLPAQAHYSEIYSLESEASFGGDGIRYHVFSCDNPEPVNEMCSWQTAESDTASYTSYVEACSEWLSEIGVPAEEYPDFAECCYWYQSQEEDDRDEIILFWNEGIGVLYVVECFM